MIFVDGVELIFCIRWGTLHVFSLTLPIFFQSNVSRTVRHFQYTEWPEQGVPRTADTFLDFIQQVNLFFLLYYRLTSRLSQFFHFCSDPPNEESIRSCRPDCRALRRRIGAQRCVHRVGAAHRPNANGARSRRVYDGRDGFSSLVIILFILWFSKELSELGLGS